MPNYATAADMLANGFVQMSGRTTLFVHPKMQGLMFKTITSVGQVVAAGGACSFSSSAWVLTFGLDMRLRAETGAFGAHRRVNSIEGVVASGPIRNDFFPSGTVQQSRGVWKPYDHDPIEYADALLCAVISKATRGVIVGRRGAFTSPEAIWCLHPWVDSHGGTGPTAEFAPAIVSWQTQRILPSRWSGSIALSVPAPKAAYLNHGAEAMLADIENEDVKEVYREAVDKLLLSEKYSGSVEDRFVISAVYSGPETDAPLLFTVGPAYEPKYAPHCGMLRRTDANHPGSASAESELATKGVPTAMIGYWDQSGPQPTAVQGGQIEICLTNGGYSPIFNKIWAAKVTTPFSLASVPYGTIKMTEKSPAVPASAFFAAISPASAPAPDSTEFVADRMATVVAAIDDLAAITAGAPFGSNTTTDPVLAEQIINAGESHEVVRRTAIRAVLPYLDPVARLITEFVNDVDQEVADAV